MKGYLSIGKVSKMKNVSIKSLRYYDEIGVLKPAYINPSTNYRYYTEEQMFLLDAIILCLELGIPLKDLDSYVEDEKINLQKLLNDGKCRAEEKIKTIRNCLTHLQTCLELYNHKPVSLPKSTIHDRFIPERTILSQTLQPHESEKDLSAIILRLFMLAQLLGIKVTYPSGIIYDYENKQCARSVFVTVEDVGDCVDRRIRTLPAGYYVCEQHSEHRISQGQNIFASFFGKGSQCIIETDIFDESIREQPENTLELQFFIGLKKK